jgi:hypothetical protein
MLEKLKTSSGQSAQVTETSAKNIVVGVWNLILDIIWLIMVVCIISLFIWGLVKSGVAADQILLSSIAEKVDIFLAGLGGGK